MPIEGVLAELELEGGGVRLRPFARSDLALIEEASRDPFIPLITTVPDAFSKDAGERFIERQLGRRTGGEGWSLAIHDENAGHAVGQIGLWLRNASKGRAEIGYWVVASARGSGTAARATALLSSWAWDNLDISRLSLFIEPWNTSSIRTAEAAGYEREGLLQAWERVDGVAKDMISFVQVRPHGR